LRLHRAGARYHENGHFSSWLFQIALNVSRDLARKRRASTEMPVDIVANEKEATDAACAHESNERLRSAVAKLPIEQREVLALRHDHEMSFEQMSRLLSVPASTLKSRFCAALKRLRQALSDPGEYAE
jgi:RNA polymerase sigma-70 factor (ECF subfamily)